MCNIVKIVIGLLNGFNAGLKLRNVLFAVGLVWGSSLKVVMKYAETILILHGANRVDCILYVSLRARGIFRHAF